MLADLDPLNRAVTALAGLTLLIGGFHQHRRGEWRLIRGTKAMAPSLGQVSKELARLVSALGERPTGESAARPALWRVAAPTEAAQQVLDRAAAGDDSAEVREQVRALLADPSIAGHLKSIAGAVEAALIGRAAGSDVAIAAGLRQAVRDHVERLLADGGPEPPFIERMAATRVAHGWLAVHTLELLVYRSESGSRAAVALGQQLERAERQLARSMRTLVTLRRLRPREGPAVVAQIAVGVNVHAVR